MGAVSGDPASAGKVCSSRRGGRAAAIRASRAQTSEAATKNDGETVGVRARSGSASSAPFYRRAASTSTLVSACSAALGPAAGV